MEQHNDKNTSSKPPTEKKYLIAGGNSTELIWNCPPEDRLPIAKRWLEEVEQVGFVNTEYSTPILLMMGEELCVDAILALAAAQHGASGTLLAYRVNGPIQYIRDQSKVTILLRIPFRRKHNTVIFEGIGYTVIPAKKRRNLQIHKWLAVRRARKYHLPAFGIIHYDKRKLITINVYVAETDSFVHESGSGSGSIATSIVTGWEKIMQPTGEYITVTRNEEFISVAADVRQSK